MADTPNLLQNTRPYADPEHPGNAKRYHTGELCIECHQRPAGTAWGLFWCVECNTLRMDRISANLAEIQALSTTEESDG